MKPSLDPLVFLDAAEALSRRDGFTYCCPQLSRSAKQVRGEHTDTIERTFFQDLFEVGCDSDRYTFERLYALHYGGKTKHDRDPEMTAIRVLSLCLAASIVEAGGL